MTVADAAQRSGMSEADLRAINNVPPRMLIKAGSTLIVPRGARVQEDVAAVVADSGQLSFQPEIVTRRTTVKAGRAGQRRQHRAPLQARARPTWPNGTTSRPTTRSSAAMSVVVYPAGAGRDGRARAGTGIRPAPRAHEQRRGAAWRATSASARPPSVTKTSSSKQQVVREKRGGTPSKKKR